MIQKPLAGVCIPEVLSRAECEHIRRESLRDSLKRMKRATTLVDGKAKVTSDRTCDFGWLDEPDGTWQWLKDRLISTMAKANVHTQCKISGMQTLQVLRYKPFQKFKEHFDTYSGSNRKATMVVQLSSPREYWGGGLWLDGRDHVDMDKMHEQGSAVFFPSYLKHKANAPIFGHRWSLVCWFTGEPWQ